MGSLRWQGAHRGASRHLASKAGGVLVLVAVLSLPGCSQEITSGGLAGPRGAVGATGDAGLGGTDASRSEVWRADAGPGNHGQGGPTCAGQLCSGATGEQCCQGSEVCLESGCVLPAGPCRQSEDCEADHWCDAGLGQCLPRAAGLVCEYRPPVGEFDPVVGCIWLPDGLEHPGRGDVVATPLVANLSDDNGDGRTDVEDVPDIVFLSVDRKNQGCCSVPATLRITSGKCGEDGKLQTLASLSEPLLTNDSGMAIADVDGDGVPEIFAITLVPTADDYRPQGTVAFKRVREDASQWQVLWHNETYPTFNVHTRGGATLSVADLEGDGEAELVVGNVVLNARTGALKWDGVVTAAGRGGIGNNAFLGPSSAVADLNLDGRQEVMAGNTLYAHDGAPLWTYTYTSSNSGCQGALPCDGFSAVANFDDDPEGEVVLVREGEVFVLEHDGQLKWKVALPKRSCGRNEAGPPTVADFDGDGLPEIGTAGADYYVVVKPGCDVENFAELGCAERGILWKTVNKDCSSRATASSVFDFEGDGRAEMVYADETSFRIFDGKNGRELFVDDTHRSNTRIEMPVIADVDNDGNADVVVAAAYPDRGTRAGIKVWRDRADNWVRTRRIWNQHGYHVTNITEDGRLPQPARVHWRDRRFNSWRQNVQPDGLFDAPDLVVHEVRANGGSCGVEGRLRVEVEVGNAGILSVPAGTPVRLALRAGQTTLAEVVLVTATRLLGSGRETLVHTWEVPVEWLNTSLVIKARIDPEEAINECREDNNGATLAELVCRVQG